MKRKFVTVLKSGGKFTAAHVRAIKQQVDKYMPAVTDFICYTDKDFSIPGVQLQPLVGNLPGKWSMQEVARETGHVVAGGLDMVMTRNLDWLFDIPVGRNDYFGTKPFNKHYPWGNGLQLYCGDWRRLYYEFENDRSRTMRLEQHWTYLKLRMLNANIRYLEDYGLERYSYKKDVAGKKQGGNPDLICFHGRPDPWEVSEFKDKYYGK